MSMEQGQAPETNRSPWGGRARPRICTVGHAAVDHCFDIEAFPSAPTKTPAQQYRVISGGMASNASIALARLGGDVHLHGAIGDDDAGRFLMRCLVSSGVGCAGLQQVPGASSSISAVIIDAHGERQIFNSRGDALVRAQAMDTSTLQGADIVMVDPRWMPGAETALRWARENGVLSILDGDLSPQTDLQRLSALADWSVFSESGLAAFAPGLSMADALRQALRDGTQMAVVTMGQRGVAWLRKGPNGELDGAVQTIASFEIKAVDTNGAGDVFHAALALALGEGQTDVRAAIQFACAAAALKCMRNGGVVRGPDRVEVEAFLAAHTPERV